MLIHRLRRWPNIKTPLSQHIVTTAVPENTIPWPNVELMLGQRRRRWPSMNPTLVELTIKPLSATVIVFNLFYLAVQIRSSQQTQNICITFIQRRPTSSTLVQHCINVIQMFCVCWVRGFVKLKKIPKSEKNSEVCGWVNPQLGL